MTHQESYQELVTRLNNAIKHRDHQLVVYIIDIIFHHNHWFEVTSARAHALAMLGNFEQALCFAQQMIDSYPTLALGYLAKGKVYSLYGYQQKAINIYKKGSCRSSATTGAGTTALCITNVNDRRQQQQQQILELTNEEKKASALQEKRIDFFGKPFPPFEIVDSIISSLSIPTLVICLSVSKLWRTRILECKDIWKSVSIKEDAINQQEDIQLLIGVLKHIAPHIIDFTINTHNTLAIRKCFEYIDNGYFTNIKSLELMDQTTQHVHSRTIMSSLASLQTKANGFNTFKIYLAYNNGYNEITVGEILRSSSAIQTLIYSTTTLLQTTPLQNVSPILIDHALIDLKIIAGTIIGQNFEYIFQRCQQLRRLVLRGMHSRVFDTLFRNTTPSLEIFVLNPELASRIPVLQDIETRRPATGGPRLQILHLSSYRYAIPSYAALPLIHKHRKTLETINGSISSMAPMSQLLTSYGHFKLDSIKRLIIWFIDQPTQEFWLGLIRQTTMLHELDAVGVVDVVSFVHTLMNISPIANLSLCHLRLDSRSAFNSLVTLFERYSKMSAANASSSSKSSSLSTPKEYLEMITLRDCHGITDNLLSVLESISTLYSVCLDGLYNVSSVAIKHFITHLSNQLTHVQFENMVQVDDMIMMALGDMSKLSSVKIKQLQNVTDQGIRSLVERKDKNVTTTVVKLNKLIIIHCLSISISCIQFAKKKVKIVEYSP